MPTALAMSARSSSRIVRRKPLLGKPLAGLLRRHRDQIVELHHAAGARLERLAVGAVHRAVAEMFERGLAGETGLARGAEHLLEMSVLALVDDIENEIGILVADAIDDGGEIGGAVEHGAVGFQQDQRRHFLLVARFGHRNDQRAFAHHRDPARLQIRDHRGNQGIDIRLAFPQIEGDAEACEFALADHAPKPRKNGATARGSPAGPPAARRSPPGPRRAVRDRLCTPQRRRDRFPPDRPSTPAILRDRGRCSRHRNRRARFRAGRSRR